MISWLRQKPADLDLLFLLESIEIRNLTHRVLIMLNIVYTCILARQSSVFLKASVGGSATCNLRIIHQSINMRGYV